MYLDDLRVGERATVADLSNVNQLLKRRLIDMGLHEGAQVCLKCLMPFGGPCMIETEGQFISIRRKEAAGIRVKQ